MLSCHLDDSRGSRNLVVAGFLGGQQDWGFFEREWLDALKKYHVPSPFKMQHWQTRKRVFRLMPEQKRRDLLNDLLAIIRLRATMAVGAVVSLPDYDAVFNEEAMRRRVGTPYSLCIQACIARVGTWARLYSHNERIAYVLDRGHANAGDAWLSYKHCAADEATAEKHRVGPLVFEDDRVAIPLQAADLVAYEAMRYQEGQPLSEKSLRYPFKQLFLNMQVKIRIFDHQVLTELQQAEEQDFKQMPSNHAT